MDTEKYVLGEEKHTYEKKLLQKPVLAQENPNCDQGIAGGSVWITLRVRKYRGTQSWGTPPGTFQKFYLREFYLILKVNIGEEFLCASSRGRGREQF